MAISTELYVGNMKHIILREEQYRRIFENDGDSTFLDGNDNISNLGSEVSTQAIVSDENGEREMSRPQTTDNFARAQSPQQWGSVGGRRSSNTV